VAHAGGEAQGTERDRGRRAQLMEGLVHVWEENPPACTEKLNSTAAAVGGI